MIMNDGKTIDSHLKITNVRIFRFDIPLKEVFQIATMSIDTAKNVLIKIETNDGIEGWGEAASFHAIVGETQLINFAAAKELRELLAGKNPLETDSLVRMMDRFLPHNTTIKGAFDMALYDIAAKAAGLPLYLFLGGKKREIETDLTMGICDPEEAGDKALAIREQGFRKMKIKLGLDFSADHARLKNIRKAVGDDTVLRIDANQGWNRIEAKKNLETFEAFDIEFCEQPCRREDLDGMKYVSDKTNIPVMADESLFSADDAIRLVKRDAVPYFNIKLSKSGGIKNASEIAAIARAAHLPCMVGCMSETRLGITAAAHFGLTNDILTFFDLDSHLEHSEDPVEGGINIVNGMITVPDAPGIGASPDQDFLTKLEEIK